MTDRVLTDEAIKHLHEAFKDREICSVGTLREVMASHRLLRQRVKELENKLKKCDAALDEALDEIYNRPAGR